MRAMLMLHTTCGILALLAALIAPGPSAAANGRPFVRRICTQPGGVAFTTPRPCDLATNITADTTLYFDIWVPYANDASGLLDANSVTATLSWGSQTETLLAANQTFGAGYSGQVVVNDVFLAGKGYGF